MSHSLARYQLRPLRQKNDEFSDVFLTRCGNQTTRCRFRDKSDERLIEQLIVGAKHKKVQERLLEKDVQLTLDEAIDIAKTYEVTQSQMEEMVGESNKDIHGINGEENKRDNKAKKCPNCGLDHPLQPRKKWSTYGYVCLNCQKGNHWERIYSSRNQAGTRGRQRNRENSGSRLHYWSKGRCNRRRSGSGKRRRR